MHVKLAFNRNYSIFAASRPWRSTHTIGSSTRLPSVPRLILALPRPRCTHTSSHDLGISQALELCWKRSTLWVDPTSKKTPARIAAHASRLLRGRLRQGRTAEERRASCQRFGPHGASSRTRSMRVERPLYFCPEVGSSRASSTRFVLYLLALPCLTLKLCAQLFITLAHYP